MNRISFALACAVLALAGCKPSTPGAGNERGQASTPDGSAAAGQPLTIAFMPKSKGNAYFIA
ncbi:MAG TPA: hypothetical protein VFD73_03530, partial [Gemmatimonadales bacterium]|nr:hypothetical protein [Gemmatimonadales bacterium]